MIGQDVRYGLDDIGNGQRLVNRFGHQLRFHYEAKGWLFWDGRRWAADKTAYADHCAKIIAREITAEALDIESESERQAVLKHAMKSADARAIKRMLEMTRSERGVTINAALFDLDPWRLNVQNGTLDLRTGRLQSHSREDYITKLAPVEFAESAEAPTWLTFLEKISDEREELIGFLQRAVGYSLTGDIGERVVFMLHGTGANGKTVFVETIRAVLGDYAKPINAEVFAPEQRSREPYELAELLGARFVIASEVAERARLREGIIKQVTGGDRILARHPFGRPFDFSPSFKLWLVCNHKPRANSGDVALWDRIRLVPFEVRIPEADRDPNLTEKLLEERAGILAWAVRGCLDWQRRRGLEAPAAVTAATATYREEEDTLGQWLADYCDKAPGLSAGATALYQSYRRWAENTGNKPLNQTGFGRELSDRGFEKDKHTTTRLVIRLGLRLRDEVMP